MFNIKNLFSRKRTHTKITLVCFDLDNTLYDYSAAESETEVYIVELIHKLSVKHHKDFKLVDILKFFNDVKKSHMHHDPEPEKFRRALWIEQTIQKCDIKLSAKALSIYSKDLEKKYWDYLNPRLKLFPHTLETLDILKKLGKYKLATITDSDGIREIKIRRIKAIGLDRYFDYIITTDDTGKNKPAIENFEYLLKISGKKAEECIMIGDHPDVDLLNAKKLGFMTVWSKEHIPTDMHYNYVDHEIKDVKQILDVVKKYR